MVAFGHSSVGDDLKKKQKNQRRGTVEIGGGTIIRNCDNGLSFSGNLDIKVGEALFENCDNAIIQRDPPSLMQMLGLPPDMPKEHLVALITELRKNPNASQAEKMETVQASGVWERIGNAANATTVAGGIIAFAQSDMHMLGLI